MDIVLIVVFVGVQRIIVDSDVNRVVGNRIPPDEAGWQPVETMKGKGESSREAPQYQNEVIV